MVELGVWGDWGNATIPPEASYIVAVANPSFRTTKAKVIIDWADLHPAYIGGVNNPITTAEEITRIRQAMETLDVTGAWGIIGVPCEEIYKSHIQFEDIESALWLGGEWLYGFAYYNATHPPVTLEQWRDEMFLRWVRGFTNYFHQKGLKVGLAIGDVITTLEWISYLFGQPAFDYIRTNTDFNIFYSYTKDPTHFANHTIPVFAAVDYYFANRLNFWKLTRKYNAEGWQGPNIIDGLRLEVPECIKRNFPIFMSQDDVETDWSKLLQVISETPPTPLIDLSTAGGIGLAIADAILISYYVYTRVVGR